MTDLPALSDVPPDCDVDACNLPVTHIVVYDTSGIDVSAMQAKISFGLRFYCEDHAKQFMKKLQEIE